MCILALVQMMFPSLEASYKTKSSRYEVIRADCEAYIIMSNCILKLDERLQPIIFLTMSLAFWK